MEDNTAQPMDFSFDDTQIAFRHKSNAELTHYCVYNRLVN